MLCTEIVSDVQNNFSTEHVLPMFWKKKSFWQRLTCTAMERLREHIILQHSDSAQFKCDTCQRKFASGPRLRDHIKQTHTRERCEICGEELYNMHYLRKHKASVHGILPPKSHKCHFCPDFFMQEHMLQKHLEKKHS